MPRIGFSGEGIANQRSASGAGDDHYFARALLVGNVATVGALCDGHEEALTTLNRLAREPVSFVHLGKFRYGPEWDSLRTDPRFQRLMIDSEAALKTQPGQ